MAVFGAVDLQRLDGELKGIPTGELRRLVQLALTGIGQQTGELTPERATRLQKALIAGRQFQAARELGEGLREAGISSGILGKFLAQAIIDSGQLAQAENLVQRLLAEISPADPEYLELQGLWGRIAKQRYLNDCQNGRAQPRDLLAAIDRYLSIYETDPNQPTWHGINAVALLSRAQRDGISHREAPRLLEIAGEILSRIQKSWDSGTLEFWDSATASEAALALGRPDAAELWLYRYLENQDTPAFAIASTLRQYREVWNLTPRTLPGSVLLPLLERKLAETGQILVPLENSRTGTDREVFEKVFGKASFMSYGKYLLGIERAKGVARIEDKEGDPHGTGFLMRGSDLGPLFAPFPFVLLTNAHVISESDPDAALSPDNARCTFYGLTSGQGGTPTAAAVKEILWSSPPDALDTTIVSLDGTLTGVEPFPFAKALPKTGPDSKIFIIGYPQGGGLSFSLFDSELLGDEEKGTKIHYRTPTEPGSSGSPVFNANWELVAIHHSGAPDMKRLDGPGTYEANEGIKILSLRKAIATTPENEARRQTVKKGDKIRQQVEATGRAKKKKRPLVSRKPPLSGTMMFSEGEEVTPPPVPAGGKVSRRKKAAPPEAEALPPERPPELTAKMSDTSSAVAEELQTVQLGGSVPRQTKPGSEFTARFVAYEKALEREVEKLLKKLAPSVKPLLGLQECRWQRGTLVTVQLAASGLTVDPPEQAFTWQGGRSLLEFDVAVPDGAEEGTIPVKFNVFIEGILVARLRLDLEIQITPKKKGRATAAVEPFKSAFASYSSKDRLRVLDRVDSLQITTGMDIFLDCLDLHPGKAWQSRLDYEIRHRDTFLLFWSNNARKSKWVGWELDTALQEKKDTEEFLQIHPLEPEVEPPPGLEELHVGSAVMWVRKGVEAVQAERKNVGPK